MKLAIRIAFLLACAAYVVAFKDDSHKPAGGDKVLLREVSTLTLYEGKMTNARRSRPVAQLKCTGGSTRCKSQSMPQVMQCYNKGWDGSDVNWECKAELDKSYKLGPVEVSCEGYDYPDDPYILKGSCGAEYKLDFTAHGEQAQKREHQQSGGLFSNWFGGGQRQQSGVHLPQKKSWLGGTGTLAMIGLIIFVVYKKFIAPAAQPGAPLRGGAHEDHWYSRYLPQNPQNPDAPPPYGFHDSAGSGAARPPPYDDSRYKNPNIHGATSSHASTSTSSFWPGALSGAAMGYMFGRRGQGAETRQQASPYSNARSTMNETMSSGPSTTTTTHTSTSYGTTKRR